MYEIKVVAISDTHGSHRALGKLSGDILIHAGDFMYSGKDEREIIDFNDWLGEQDFKDKIVVAGNHDLLFQRRRIGATSLLKNAIYLEDSSVMVQGLNIHGSPYTPTFYNWAFMEDPGENLARHWRLIPDETDILVTHGPRRGVLDLVIYDNVHVGCADLLEAVDRIKPKLHISGHIHCAHGRHTNKYTHSINASICNEAYKPVHQSSTFFLNDPLARPESAPTMGHAQADPDRPGD
jgi:Icc-related predicted phosphoesterase